MMHSLQILIRCIHWIGPIVQVHHLNAQAVREKFLSHGLLIYIRSMIESAIALVLNARSLA
jgi:hypothetical protein